MTRLFTRYRLAIAALVLLSFQPASCAAAEQQPDTLIINATLISAERSEPLRNAWVRIHGDRIVEVGTGLPNQVDAQVIDAEHGFIIPGLIDSHVHLYHATGLRRRYTDDFDALYRGYMEQQPRSLLFHGFTTVIELNADLETNHRFEAAPVHPRLVHCGEGVVLSDGFMALELEGTPVGDVYPGYLFDHFGEGVLPEGADPTAHTPRAVVDYVVAQGGTCIKLYYEEANWWPGGAPFFRLPSVEIVREVVAEAHAQGLAVILHATTPAGHAFGLESNVDILGHGMWEWTDQTFVDPNPSPDTHEIARQVAASGIGIQPTFQTIKNTASLFHPELLEDPAWRDVVPSTYLDYLRTDAQVQREAFVGMFGDAMLEEGMTLADVPDAQAAFSHRYERLIGEISADGGQLLFGSDTAVGGFGWASPPGLAGYWEMQGWVRAGIPLATLFRSLTIDNALAFGIDDEIGTIEPGKRADLLILSANPLVDIAAYNAIEQIILAGVPIEREHLSAEHID